MQLLNIDNNAKIVKNKKKYYRTAGLHLAPSTSSGHQCCPMATPGCIAACLNTAGRGRFDKTQNARIRKTKMFFEQREEFMKLLEKELDLFVKRVKKEAREKKKKITPCVRMNLTSDLRWENIPVKDASGKEYKNLMERFPNVQFYDYTKIPNRKNVPSNYHLTFSLAENNDDNAKKAIKNGMNLAVVFRTKEFPKKYFGLPVINGDDDDLRFLNGNGNCIALYAKGKAKKDFSGFVKDVASA